MRQALVRRSRMLLVAAAAALLGAGSSCGGDSGAPAPSPSDGGQAGGRGGQSGQGGQGGSGGATGSPATGGGSGRGGSAPAGSGGTSGDAAVPGDAPAGGQAGADAGGEAAAACQACASWGEPQPGRIEGAGLTNLSGMAASWRNPGLLFVHNDRNEPRFFAVEQGGRLRGDFTLMGATVADIEDMAVSRCPEPPGTCVFVADIGNNVTSRSVFSIYRAAEPEVPASASGASVSLPAQRFAFSYADGPHNAEALVVDANSGAVFIITKEVAGRASSAYRLETFEVGRTNMAVKVADLPVPASADQPATAASGHPCGLGFLLRTGNRLYEFRVAPGAPFADAFQATPVVVPAGQEQQSEAVTYGPDGRSFFTTGEGVSPALFRTICAPGS